MKNYTHLDRSFFQPLTEDVSEIFTPWPPSVLGSQQVQIF